MDAEILAAVKNFGLPPSEVADSVSAQCLFPSYFDISLHLPLNKYKSRGHTKSFSISAIYKKLKDTDSHSGSVHLISKFWRTSFALNLPNQFPQKLVN
jgi:hypothetical protein